MASFEWEYDSLGPGLGARHVAPGAGRFHPPRNDFLSPSHMRQEHHVSTGGGIRRSRSTGTRPVPNIQIFNKVEQDAHPRFDAYARVSPPRTPRGRVMEDEWADHRSPSRGRMFHDHHHDHHHFRFPESPDNRATQVALQDQRIRELEERLRRENEEEILRTKYENELLREQLEREGEEELMRRRFQLHMLKDKAKRDEEEKRIRDDEERLKDKYERQRAEAERKRLEHERELKQIKDEAVRKEKERIEKEEAAQKAAAEEWERRKDAAKKKEDEKRAAQLLAWKLEEKEKAEKAAEAAKKAAEDRKRMIEDHEAEVARQAKEEAERKQRIIDQYHKDKKEAAEKAKAAEEALKLKMEKEAKEAAERAKQEEEEYERKRQAKIEKEKKEKKEAEEKFEKEMRERLQKAGLSEEQIQEMIKGEKAKENNQLTINVGSHRHDHHRSGTPTYIKIHKNHIEIATLTYFGLPWEYDRNSDYIIILQEMDHRETEVLFEHTKSLRRRTMLCIEERPRHSGKNELVMVRRRGRSKSAVRTPCRFLF